MMKEKKVRWDDFVRRVPKYLRGEYRGQSDSSKHIYNRLMEVSPAPGKDTKGAFRFIRSVINLTNPTLPMPPVDGC